jgi:hypothetical protein
LLATFFLGGGGLGPLLLGLLVWERLFQSWRNYFSNSVFKGGIEVAWVPDCHRNVSSIFFGLDDRLTFFG